MIPYGRQIISEQDIAAVTAVLRSDFLTQGPVVPRFEDALAARVGAGFGVAVNSATSALHIACLALDLGPGDLLWTVPTTFVASANCALYCGADVDFVDIDPKTWLMSVEALEQKLAAARAAGRLPKIVVPVHLSGEPCDMEAIAKLAKIYGFKVIEDASHAVGGKYRGQAVGNGSFSDITVFSFHPVKIITTGEGGMAMTNDPALAKRMALLRSHGITRDEADMTHTSDGPWYYQQIALGFNYRLTELQAALGLSQLAELERFVEQRQDIAARYDTMLARLPVTLPCRDARNLSALHLYVIRVPKKAGVAPHRTVFERLREGGIGVNLHYIPVHLQPWYLAKGFRAGQFPNAEAYYAEAISLPIFPLLTLSQQEHVVAELEKALAA